MTRLETALLEICAILDAFAASSAKTQGASRIGARDVAQRDAIQNAGNARWQARRFASFRSAIFFS
jgi:hypothetical protein